MTSVSEQVGMDDDFLRATGYATCDALLECGLRDLHVGVLDDQPRAQTLSHQSNLTYDGIGFGLSAAVVDDKKRAPSAHGPDQ